MTLAAAASSKMATADLIRFIKLEADQAEEKAKRLREQANMLAQQYGESLEEFGVPLDEHGLPKYKGKRRGRKPKKRLRVHDPNKPKRKHTAYTIFVQENYASLKAMQPSLQSKDIIGMVARQWASLTPIEKAAWKDRALQADEDELAAGGVRGGDHDEDEAEDVVEVDDEEVEHVQELPKKRGRGRPKSKGKGAI